VGEFQVYAWPGQIERGGLRKETKGGEQGPRWGGTRLTLFFFFLQQQGTTKSHDNRKLLKGAKKSRKKEVVG